MTNMKIRPLADKVLIQRTEAQNTTKGGIVLPESAKEKPRQGKIIAVGDGKVLADGSRSPFQVKKGDLVLFSSYGGTEVKIDGKEMLIMEEADIMAVLKN
jgi:chaperonin GroES